VEALKFAGDRPWDALLLDIGMPDLDGYAVARKLRDRPEGRRLFLVALTGYGQRQDVESALAAGFDTHLTKPASFEALRTALDQAAERKQSPGSPGPSERASGLVGPG